MLDDSLLKSATFDRCFIMTKKHFTVLIFKKAKIYLISWPIHDQLFTWLYITNMVGYNRFILLSGGWFYGYIKPVKSRNDR